MPNASSTARLPLALPTAMHDDASLDLDAITALAATVTDAGADAVSVLVLGSGEVAELDDDERADVVAAARRGAGGAPVLAGIGAPGPVQLATARRLVDAGADVLIVPVAGAPDRAVELVGQVAALEVPLLVHHAPGGNAGAATAAEVAGAAREVGVAGVVHDAVPVPDGVATLVAGGVTVLGGLGGLFLPEELDAGAHGSAAASAVPEHLVEIVRRHQRGDVGAAREAHLLASAYLRFEAGSAGTTVRKEAWRQRGVLRSGRVRRGRPLGAATKTAITRRLGDLGTELRAPWPGA